MRIEKSTTMKIKFEALKWLRLNQRCAFIATEAGAFSADVLGINEKRMVEVEVKVSIGDLKADFRKIKHTNYSRQNHDGYQWEMRWIPTHFYYAMPSEMVAEARTLLDAKGYGNYGIICYEDWVIAKRAAWLHKREPDSHVKFVLALRMGSELIRFHEAWL